VRRIDHIVIHHTASPPTTTVDQIRSWHLARGFADIGYHFIITGDGMMHVGRPIDKSGAHVQGNNRHTIGIAITGNNMVVGQEWSFIQKYILKALLSVLTVMFPEAKVVGHNDLANTSCPGLPFHYNHDSHV
jgi:N-acetylmuramoyl-L-alanine amidase